MGERKLSASREARRRMAEARRERRYERTELRRDTEAREALRRAALSRRPDSPLLAVERLLADDPDGPRSASLRELLRPVVDRAPRMACAGMLEALRLVADAGWVRPPSAWRPEGKSEHRLFRSLAEHVLAKYPMPPFVWDAFFANEDAPTLARVVVHVAAGRSLYQAVKSGLMPVPLTRAMCHELMSGRGEARFLDAVRRVQVRAAGGDARLFRTWVATRPGQRLHVRPDEEFWQTIVAWLSANPMLPQAEVAPLVDYIADRRAQSPDFSIKGRSVLAMQRAMREWHGQLATARAAAGRVFPASGFEPVDLDWSRYARNGRVVEVWHFREIRDARTLADEGRAMGHCVFSYARHIERGECAIWTATLHDGTGHWRRMTIEVRPLLRRVVQARGRFNRLPEPRDVMALEAWAARNRLQVSIGRW